jgi:hypothetical protein
VSPSNLDYARALRALLDSPTAGLGLHNGIIVQDTNDDPYPRTLRDAFAAELGPYLKFPSRPFTGGTVGAPAVRDVFAPVVTDICNAVVDQKTPLDMIFYAGRVADFEVFAKALDGRTCQKTPLAVLVGATGFQAAQQYVDLLNRENVTVIYASSADAPEWAKGANNTPEGFGRFLSAFKDEKFPDPQEKSPLTDGYAISYHDALATAAMAIRVAAEGRQVPKPADVDVQFGALSLSHVVRAASGTLVFSDRPDGRAKDKVVVYRQIGSDGPRLPPGLAPYYTR